MIDRVDLAAGLPLALTDDAGREFAYDRGSHIGKLERGLDEGPRRGWTIVSMKDDWKTLYPAAPR